MNILIIEDEQPNANRLIKLLAELREDVHIMGVLASVEESVNYLISHPQPDLILMDIRLGDGLCFEIFPKVTINCPVIFTTAYDEYALRAFKIYSLAYLLKPVEKNELKEALSIYDHIIQEANPNKALDQLVDYIKSKSVIYRSRFLLPYKDGYKTILASSIDYIYSEHKITHLVLDDQTDLIVPFTMDELEDQLDPVCFFRANRQHMIHVNSIFSIHNYFNGKLKVILKSKNAGEIIISKEKSGQFKAWLDR
ncbi:LytTR family DNA-binding domain-containing protein [Pedobacter sp. PLR]|uniref:LytR/AlgR family response regulator transcription factor n=1 Tax=Pedobacter sp. PLR TaxID=2994465 RepID=UPI002247C85C|nr:LytTR family DNA-binding domain-containing protein [Pedobacter sp. PLR]MCX2450223.1 LytTR family DNA-binding domain-containing protein [Pedobacter sp. PLR]